MDNFTKVPYPQVIKRVLEAINCPLTISGCYEAAAILRSREADAIRITSGEFEGCWDSERINSEIADQVLLQYPQLLPIIKDFRDEGSDFCSLCGWLNHFIESVAWLTGNRPWIFCDMIPVKRGPKLCCGMLNVVNSKYFVCSDGKLQKVYDSALEMAFDGWTVD